MKNKYQILKTCSKEILTFQLSQINHKKLMESEKKNFGMNTACTFEFEYIWIYIFKYAPWSKTSNVWENFILAQQIEWKRNQQDWIHVQMLFAFYHLTMIGVVKGNAGICMTVSYLVECISAQGQTFTMWMLAHPFFYLPHFGLQKAWLILFTEIIFNSHWHWSYPRFE